MKIVNQYNGRLSASFSLSIIQTAKTTSIKIPNHLRNYKTPVNFQTLGRKRLLTLLTHPSTGAKPPQNRPIHFSYLKYLLSRKYHISSLRFIAERLPFNIFKIYSHSVFLKYSSSTAAVLSGKYSRFTVTRLGPKTQSAPISWVLLKYLMSLSRTCPGIPDIVLL